MKVAAWLKRHYVALILSWVALLGVFQASYHTLTSDEAIHTASAYLALTRGEHRFDPEHPFLFKYLTALPFLVYKTNLPEHDQELWQQAKPTFYDAWLEARLWAEWWVYESGNNAFVMQMLMRVPGIMVLTLLCWFTWWLSRHWFNQRVANWTLFFTAFTTTLLAHGFLTNTDVPLAFTVLLCIWRMGEYAHEQGWRNTLWIGVTLGIALLTKFSAIALVPVVLIWLIAVNWRKRRWLKVLGELMLIVVICWSLIWLTYGFSSPLYAGASDFASANARFLQDYGRVVHLEHIAVFAQKLLPTAWTKGMLMVVNGGELGRESYILNHTYPQGVWFYFPILFLLKNQLTYLIVLAIGLGLALPRLRTFRNWRPEVWVIVLTGAVFSYLALTSKLNLGIRHISPLFPLLAIGAGATMVIIKPIWKSFWVPALVISTMALPVFFQATNLIAYSNSFIPTAESKHYFFQDSNLDWEQSWKRVADVLNKEFPEQPVYLRHLASELHYFAPSHAQEDLSRPGSQGSGAILLSASDLNTDYSTYQQYQPAFVIDDAYFIYRTGNLVPR